MSCLFNTLCKFVELEGEELRHNICNYLSNNPKMFENISAVQFDHRWLAVITVLFIVWLFQRARKQGIKGRAKVAVNTMAVIAIVQVGLGISTLLYSVPIFLASAHQVGALLLLSSAVWALHELRTHSVR